MNDPKTVISFDLSAVLTPEELEKFKAAAAAAGARDLTEHFLAITIRAESKPAA